VLTFDSCLAKATPSTKFTDNKLCYSLIMNTADSASAKKILTSFKSILFLGLHGMKATLSIVMTIGHRQELNSPKKEENNKCFAKRSLHE